MTVIVFWVAEGILHNEFSTKGETRNAYWYTQILGELKENIWFKMREELR